MISADPGSFRDPASRIFLDGDRVIRALDDRGLDAWKHLAASPFYPDAVAEGLVVASREVGQAPPGAAGALEHPRIAFISYPYEWTFSMLKDAALLQLELLERALGDGLTIKDATPFNIQFVDGKPVFIDIGSFEPYRDGEPWIGYRQFTRQFLFPLMLQAWSGIPFQPWMRGNPEGPTAGDMRALLPLRRRLGRTGLMHVLLQARMEQRLSGLPARRSLREAGFSAELILSNVRGLARVIRGLERGPGATGWADYRTYTHVGRDRETKREFLERTLGRVRPARVLDLGANDGYFSEVAANSGALVIAVDGDEQILDSLYARSQAGNLSIVVTDLTNPSPSQGWAGVERPSLQSRAQPDLVIAYGLIHHLIYTASIPPALVVDWLRGFEADVVVEFVAPDDEMVQVLTANKLEDELQPDRTEQDFRSLLAERFHIRAEQGLAGGSRVLFALSPSG